eukprot:4612828-Karenia_brevis.AAC.1
MALGLQHRWWGLLGVALQRAVADAVLNDHSDLPRTQLEPLTHWDSPGSWCGLILTYWRRRYRGDCSTTSNE